jgi:hypothetical protein
MSRVMLGTGHRTLRHSEPPAAPTQPGVPQMVLFAVQTVLADPAVTIPARRGSQAHWLNGNPLLPYSAFGSIQATLPPTP